jgi:hypothetical protein
MDTRHMIARSEAERQALALPETSRLPFVTLLQSPPGASAETPRTPSRETG